MQPDIIIIRLGELTLKGRNRRRFEEQIGGQVRRLLEPFSGIAMREDFGRIYIELNGADAEQITGRLSHVFGIHSYSPAFLAKLELSDILDKAARLVGSLNPAPGTTFKVSVRRAYKPFPYDTRELAPLVSEAVLRQVKGLKVDVHRPELELRTEVRAEAVYLYVSVYKGTGGFPLGTNGKAMLMLSGGIDSPVAGWLAMRRGLAIEAVHFHSYPFTSERAQQKVVDLTNRLSLYAGKIKLHMVPFTEIQTRLRETGRDHLLITLMRRAMLRITEKLAERAGALAIVTGESLGQVASQTLPSLNVIGQVAGIPLLRPLIMSDKAEIIKLAEQIGTYDISILPYEDCCTLFVPKAPSTNPNLNIVTATEQQLAWLVPAIEKAVKETETQEIVWGQMKELDRFF